MTDLGTLLLQVQVNTAQFSSQMAKVSAGITKTGLAFAAIGAAAVGAMVLATKAAIDFEEGMARVATLLDGDVKGRISELSDEVKDLQKTTGIGFDTLQDGLYETISAFQDSADSMGILQVAAEGAAAGGSTVKDSVKLLSSVMKGYNDVSEESAQKTADLAFKTVKLGQTTFPELASSMGKVIPMAAALGVKQEELFTGFSTLTGVTGDASEVATQYRGILTSMLKPSDNMTAALEKLGIENAKVGIETLGLQGFMLKLKEAVGDDELAFANLFGRVRAMTGALALTGAQADTFASKALEMADATGASSEAFAIMQDTTAATMDRMKQGFSVFKVELGEKLLPLFKQAADALERFTTKISNMTDAQFENIASTLKTIASIAGIVVALVGLIKMMSAAVTAINGVNAALLLLAANPIVLAIMAIVAVLALVVVGIVAVVKAEEDRKNKVIAFYKEELAVKLSAIDEASQAQRDAINEQITTNATALESELSNIEKIKVAGIEALDVSIKRRELHHERVIAVAERTKTAALKVIADEYDGVAGSYKGRLEVVKDYYADLITAANKAYSEESKLLEGAFATEKSLREGAMTFKLTAVDREKARAVAEIDDRIKLLQGASEEEVNASKKTRTETEAIRLEDLIAAETDADEKKLLIDEREKLISEAIALAADTNLAKQQWALREEALEVKTTMESRKTDIETQHAAEITELETNLATALGLLKTNVDKEIEELERRRDEQERLLKEEREAKEKSEDDKLQYTKDKAQEQIDFMKNTWQPEMAEQYAIDAEAAIGAAKDKAAGIELALTNDRQAIIDIDNRLKAAGARQTGVDKTEDLKTDAQKGIDKVNFAMGLMDSISNAEGSSTPERGVVTGTTETTNSVVINANYNVTDEATAKLASDDLVLKLQTRGIGGSQR